jgi:LCP family protein required for cell wall assembly
MANFDGIKRPAPKIEISNEPQKNSVPQQVSLLTNKVHKRRRWPKLIAVGLILIVILFGGYIAVRTINLSSKIFVGQKTTFFQKISELIRGPSGGGETLIGQSSGQINILLLGIGGAGHDGPFLTDTMIVAQIRPNGEGVTLTSIPRDYLAQLPDSLGQQKINSAFTYGLGKNGDWNRGGQWAIAQAEKLSGLKIPYFAVIDFSGFEKAIDQVGGVDVHVDRTFTDYSYPDNGTGYLPPLTFTEGDQHMNGTKALQFARSRHAAGIEGSDFSRSQRQQKIIQAFKQKILSANLIKDASALNGLMGIFADHFHTNMSPAEIFQLYNLTNKKTISTLSLSLDPETKLICPEILASNSAYVLTPCPGKSEVDIQNFFKNSFSIGKLAAEKSTVWLASSTGNKAAYNTAYRKLTDAGLTVFQLSYGKDDLNSTIVYQANAKPATAEFIKNELHATEAILPPPGVIADKNKVDVIVVLGTDAPVEPEPKPYIAPPAKTASSTLENQPQGTTTASSTINSLQQH